MSVEEFLKNVGDRMKRNRIKIKILQGNRERSIV